MAEQRREFDRQLNAIEAKVMELFAMVREDLPAVTQAVLNGNTLPGPLTPGRWTYLAELQQPHPQPCPSINPADPDAYRGGEVSPRETATSSASTRPRYRGPRHRPRARIGDLILGGTGRHRSVGCGRPPHPISL